MYEVWLHKKENVLFFDVEHKDGKTTYLFKIHKDIPGWVNFVVNMKEIQEFQNIINCIGDKMGNPVVEIMEHKIEALVKLRTLFFSIHKEFIMEVITPQKLPVLEDIVKVD